MRATNENAETVAEPGDSDPWDAVNRLVSAASQPGGATQAVLSTVAAVRQEVEADSAFWYDNRTRRVSCPAGECQLDDAQLAKIARRLMGGLRPGREVVAWSNPDPADHRLPAAALLALAPGATGCLVAVRGHPGPRFRPADRRVARAAVRMLAGRRAAVQADTKQLLLGLVHSLTAVIEAKDPYTAGHSERSARIAVLIGTAMGLPAAEVGDLYLAGLLHDVGKIGVRDEILQKPGRLTPEEFDQIREHPAIGERVVAGIKPFGALRAAVRHHHERWDGAGYPDRLAGEDIPLPARIMALADACDAMLSPRRYRPGLTPAQIDAVLREESGRQWDPAVVAAFMTVRDQVYPPIYQKGIGDSAAHALELLTDHPTDLGMSSHTHDPTAHGQEDGPVECRRGGGF